MNQQQMAELFALAANYWPNIKRNNEAAGMVSAWAESLWDVPYNAAKRAIVELSRKCDFPPSPKMVREESSKHSAYNPEINWSMRLAWDRYTELGIPLPKWFYAGVQSLGESCPTEFLEACCDRQQISAEACV